MHFLQEDSFFSAVCCGGLRVVNGSLFLDFFYFERLKLCGPFFQNIVKKGILDALPPKSRVTLLHPTSFRRQEKLYIEGFGYSTIQILGVKTYQVCGAMEQRPHSCRREQSLQKQFSRAVAVYFQETIA